MRILLYSFLLFWVVGCASEAISPQLADQSSTGIGGSYARFMIIGDFLYVVDTKGIKTYSLSDPASPNLLAYQEIGSSIETIFHLNGRLFIGSGSGLYIYLIGNDGIPVAAGEFSYSIWDFQPCDPVVANDSYAFVTLNSTVRQEVCRTNATNLVNELNVFDVTDLFNPVLVSTFPMDNPKGVGLDGETLFVCDNESGLKVFDVSYPMSIHPIAIIDDITAYDVIPLGGLLLVVGPENVYQYDYTDLNNIKLVSFIAYGT